MVGGVCGDREAAGDFEMTESRDAIAALIAVLKAVSVTGPDADGLLWVHFEPEGVAIKAVVSVLAESLVGKTVAQWRDDRLAAIMKMAASIAEHDGVSG